jgi:hypothetical protein
VDWLACSGGEVLGKPGRGFAESDLVDCEDVVELLVWKDDFNSGSVFVGARVQELVGGAVL